MNLELAISDLLLDDDKLYVKAFQQRARELVATRIITGPGRIHARISMESGKSPDVKVELPSEDDLRSFYMAFRFFYLQKEPAHFLRVLNIVERRAASDMVSRYITRLREVWNGGLNRRGWKMSVNGEELTTALLIDLWFNAHYFHSDADKTQALATLNNILSVEFNRFLLADAVFASSEAVVHLYGSIRSMKL